MLVVACVAAAVTVVLQNAVEGAEGASANPGRDSRIDSRLLALDRERTVPGALDVVGGGVCDTASNGCVGLCANCALVFNESIKALELADENVDGVVGIETDVIVEVDDVRIRPGALLPSRVFCDLRASEVGGAVIGVDGSVSTDGPFTCVGEDESTGGSA